MEGVGCRVQGVGCRVWGLGCWVEVEDGVSRVEGEGLGGTMRCCLAEDVAFPPSLDTPPEGYGCTGGRLLAWRSV